MHSGDYRGGSRLFLQPQNGTNIRSPGYVPGRIVPLRPPPLPKTQASAKFNSAGQEAHATFGFNGDEQNNHAKIIRRRRHKNTLICFAISSLSFFIILAIVLGISSKYAPDENCPDQNYYLSNWNPGHDTTKKVVIKKGDLLRLQSDATVYSITIQDGGKLVFEDDANGSKNITLRTRFILIKDGGALHIGAEKCRYKSRANIILYGKSDEGDSYPVFGRKFIGVSSGGTLELHGSQKLSWTLLTKSLTSSGLAAGSYNFERTFFRGLNVRVVDQETAQVLVTEKFDTYESQSESKRLQEFLNALPPGRIVAMAVGDSAERNLLEDTQLTIHRLLGSNLVRGLGYRQAWALVSVVGGSNTSCSESTKDYENHSTGGKAEAMNIFSTLDGQKFAVKAYSEWKDGKAFSGFVVEAVDGIILDLMDDVRSWQPGDQIIVSSTDYSMYQAEEFTLLPCPECNTFQVKVKETPLYFHMGEITDGLDMRAEVGDLTRNIVIQGEMQKTCYGNNQCQFFNYDTFGGHIKIVQNFTFVHLSNVELKNMGQQVMGSYPVHFHLCGDVDDSNTYVEGLSIHHSFSRCVTVHATNGLLIKDTIGYDTLGHCFFLEDGIEQRNTLFHNLGLVTKPGTLLPTDRNSTMCTAMRDKVYGNYIPNPATDCMAASTFWIANPNNNLIGNAAAGSQDAGIWFVFHKSSTGESHGLYPDTKAELTPLGIFYNNRVHSNFKAGLFIDKGVKTTHASAEDPREYLCLDNNARFRPHVDADPLKPRVAAVIDSLVAFKNNDHGAWVRGGDIIIHNSGFSDNGIGLTFASDGSFPKDEGSSQEVSESLFIGESRNFGFQGGQNKYWGTGGVYNRNRTLPRNRTFPIRGFQIYDGPIRLTKCTFKNFVPTPDRFTSAIGFLMKNPWQLTPRNNVSFLKFGANVSLRAFFGQPGPWFETGDLDGDKNSIFHDVDGSVTNYNNTFLARMDNYLIRHPKCINITEWNGVICSGTYAQVYIQARNPQNLTMTIARDEYPSKPMSLRGINQKAPSQQYQPVVMLQKGYTIHWNAQAPQTIHLYLINFDKGDWIRVGLCYPPDTSFQVMSQIVKSQTFPVEEYQPVNSLDELEKIRTQAKYFFDNSTGLLFLFLQAKHNRESHSYCSSQGCERVMINATFRSKANSNCMTKAYPKYSKAPTATKPMPAKSTATCTSCGASQVVFASDPHNIYLPLEIQSLSKEEIQQGAVESFIAVNGTKYSSKKTGLLVVVIDACTGIVKEDLYFPQEDFERLEKYLGSKVPQRSVVVLASRGYIADFGNLAQQLHILGTAKPAFLHSKGSIAFLGFNGKFKPSWTRLSTSPAGQGLGLIERYIPLQQEAYECRRVSTSKRKDVDLLKKALKTH
ncbi:PREDICTED: transmembrane protein 2 [Nanorana parkeri]|uniref:transmembrane protein 2 n=1 Tax=Nanorana parkeri TaxID=125878 RepID=UPI00085457C7|nr:PREDICTED: transmembrane protein 2 [Nanorana parkeri]XP_018417777.1 PREDICTED: transmembrane protein 2 [Nanorana parkeri]